MTESQIDSNTDFAEQNNILNFSQQKQTLKCESRFHILVSRNKISMETRKELFQNSNCIVSNKFLY